MSKQNLNCGSCISLNREKCFEKRCGELGKIPASKACGSYKPDVFGLVGTGQQMARLTKIADAISGMTATELQTLGAVLHAERNTRKAGWKFHQKVYVRYTGSADRNYLSNFMVGYVLYADKEYVRIVGESGKMFISLMNEKNSTSLYTVERFNPVRREMIDSKKFVDPKSITSVQTSNRGSIAKFDDVMGDERATKKLKAKKAREDDLVSIVSRMQRGIIGRTGGKKKRKSDSDVGGEIVMPR